VEEPIPASEDDVADEQAHGDIDNEPCDLAPGLHGPHGPFSRLGLLGVAAESQEEVRCKVSCLSLEHRLRHHPDYEQHDT